MSDRCPSFVRSSSTERETEIKTDIETDRDTDREIYGKYQNVFLTPDEYQSLVKSYPVYADKYIERLSEYMECKGKSYKNHYATILSWLKQDIKVSDYNCEEGESL